MLSGGLCTNLVLIWRVRTNSGLVWGLQANFDEFPGDKLNFLKRNLGVIHPRGEGGGGCEH